MQTAYRKNKYHKKERKLPKSYKCLLVEIF